MQSFRQILSIQFKEMIQFLDMNKQEITGTIKCEGIIYITTPIILMNKTDLFVVAKSNLYIIDLQKKEIINDIVLQLSGFLCSIYKLQNYIILVGSWGNVIEQFAYDENKKGMKLISYTRRKKLNNSENNFLYIPLVEEFFHI